MSTMIIDPTQISNVVNMLMQTPNVFIDVITDPRFEKVSTPFSDAFFQGSVQSSTKNFNVGRISPNASVALPIKSTRESGVPIYKGRDSRIDQFRAVDFKLVDNIDYNEIMDSFVTTVNSDGTAGVANLPFQLSQLGDYGIRVMAYMLDLAKQQYNAIKRSQERHAREAIIFGKSKIEYADGTSVPLDFGRDTALSFAQLSGANLWDSSETVDILAQLQNFKSVMDRSFGGGAFDTIIMGESAFNAFRNNDKISNARNLFFNIIAPTSLQMALTDNTVENPLSYEGNLGGSIAIYTYRDFEPNADGTWSETFDSRDILLMKSKATKGVKVLSPYSDGRFIGQYADIKNIQYTDLNGNSFVETQSNTTHILTTPNTGMLVRVCGQASPSVLSNPGNIFGDK